MALVTQADVEARLGRSLTASEVLSFNIVNPALQYEVERMIGSNVEADTEATRYYDGGVQHLTIDPCTNVTAVEYVDDDQDVYDTLDTTDYTLEPINRTLKTMVRHRNALVTGINNVAVTAIFSIYADSKTLAIVKDALISAVSVELQNSDNVKRESIEGYSIEFASSETASALAPIKYLFPEV